MRLYFRLKDCRNMALTPDETAILKDLKKERRVDMFAIHTYIRMCKDCKILQQIIKGNYIYN